MENAGSLLKDRDRTIETALTVHDDNEFYHCFQGANHVSMLLNTNWAPEKVWSNKVLTSVYEGLH